MNRSTGPSARVRSWVRAHRPLADAVGYASLAVFAAALGLAGFWGEFSVLPERVSPWWTLVTAIPACGLVLLRDRAPLACLFAAAVLVVVDIVTVGGVGPLVVFADVLYVATRDADSRRRRGILLGIASATIVMMGAVIVYSGDLRGALIVGLQVGALLGTGYWYATAVAQSRELVALHRRRAEDAELLAAREREAAVQQEREGMARELHDLVSGHVSAMAIRAEASLAAPPDLSRDRVALGAVRDSGLHAHEALRSMIAVLRTTGAVPAALGPRRNALPALADDARRSGLRVTVRDDIDGPLAAPVDQAASRIVQEALANCLRHAAGASVDVHLFDDGDRIAVQIASRDGAALERPPLKGSGWGLDLLRERARALGGELHAGPRGSGWLVEARLPREVAE